MNDAQSMCLEGAPEKGFLPRHISLWVTVGYLVLFIIRPWEVLFPWMRDIHFERFYAIFMIIVVVLGRGVRWRWNRENIAVLLFTIGLGITVPLALDRSLALDKYYLFFTIVVFYVVLISSIRTPHELVFIVYAYIGVMELYLGKSLWEFVVHGRRDYAMGVARLIGIDSSFAGPNSVAGSIVVSLPLWLFLWQHRGSIAANSRKIVQRIVNASLAFYFVLSIICLLLTNSRAGMLGFIFFLILAGFQKTSFLHRIRNLIAACILLAAIWFALPSSTKTRFQTIWDPTLNASAEASRMGRLEGFMAGIDMFKRRPIGGVGPGNFVLYRVTYGDGIPLEAHNLEGQVLGETGLIGTIAFSWFFLTLITSRRRYARYVADDPDFSTDILYQLAKSCVFSAIILWFEGLGGHNLYRFNWLWLMAFCSIVSVYLKNSANKKLREDDGEDQNNQDIAPSNVYEGSFTSVSKVS